MPWMKLFQTLVNGLSILDYCRWALRPRAWEGPGSGSEKKFIYLGLFSSLPMNLIYF